MSKDVAFHIVVRAESPSTAWTALRECCKPDTTSAICRLTLDFNAIAIKPGENPIEFMLRIYRTAQHFAMLGQKVPEAHVLVAIVSGLSHQYDSQRHILNSEERLTRSRVKRVTMQRFERSEAEKEKSSAITLAASTGEQAQNKIYRSYSRAGNTAPWCGRTITVEIVQQLPTLW